MPTLLKNVRVICGDDSIDKGVCDLLLAGGRIIHSARGIKAGNVGVKIFDLEGRTVAPGLVDGHVHLIGAAGDEGYGSKTPEIFMSHFMKGGVTTAVGCLGFGLGCESPQQLYVKAQTLRAEGLDSYIYTGAFRVPSPSITESAASDIVMLPYVIGVKIAISDGCSPTPSKREFGRIAGEAWCAGLQSGKAGAMQIHVGHHGDPFDFLLEVASASGVPLRQFIPTHCNWSDTLVEASFEYAKRGGYVDYSTILDTARGSLTSTAASQAILKALSSGAPAETLEKFSLSTDGNVGMPIRDENMVQHGLYLERVGSLWHEVKALISGGLDMELAISLATANPAKRAGLYPEKGVVRVGGPADLIVLDESNDIDMVFAKGVLGLEKGEPKLFSPFEKDIARETGIFHG